MQKVTRVTKAQNAPVVTPAPVTPVAPVVVPIAPAPAGLPIGKAGPKGQHHIVACSKAGKANAATVFAPDNTLSLLNAHSPWRAGSNGHTFYTTVLWPLLANGQTATVQQVLAKAKAANFQCRYGSVVNHLMWFYTWSGSGLQVNGQSYTGNNNAPQA